MVPANQAEAWRRVPSGSAEIWETAPLHLTREVFVDSRARRVPHGHGEPGSSLAGKFGPKGLPSPPRIDLQQKWSIQRKQGEGHMTVTPRTRPVGGLSATVMARGRG
jgi:hypothetical protein